MSENNTMSALAVICQYFGTRPGQSSIDFLAEVKALSTEETAELANLAAMELGVQIVEAVQT
jgi:hypothetical protein